MLDVHLPRAHHRYNRTELELTSESEIKPNLFDVPLPRAHQRYKRTELDVHLHHAHQRYNRTEIDVHLPRARQRYNRVSFDVHLSYSGTRRIASSSQHGRQRSTLAGCSKA